MSLYPALLSPGSSGRRHHLQSVMLFPALVQNTILSHEFFMNSVMNCPTANGASAIVAEDQ